MSLRIPGANAATLDAYLRGLGLLRACDRLLDGLRWSWDEDETMVVHGVDSLDTLVDALMAAPEPFAPVATPWRGKAGKEHSFRELRNIADERLLDWFDACGVAQTGKGEMSSRHNPLLGQGGGFGRSEVAAGAEAARERLQKALARPERAREALKALLAGEAPDPRAAAAVQVTKKAIGAYQSGRGTGPGASRRDVDPSTQAASTNAWDLLLVLEGVRLFRGALVRRPGVGGREQASFPLIVRAAAIGLDDANREQDRVDDDRAYELLAPLWAAPLRARTVATAIARARLRLHDSRHVRVADDALDAVLAAHASADLQGFDRIVRFVLYAPSDPRYRYALRRAVVSAKARERASWAVADVLEFMRRQARVEPRGENRTAAHRRAEHMLAEALANEGDVVGALVALERIGARAHPASSLSSLRLPRLRPSWLISDDPARRLAAAIAGAAEDPDDNRASWLRRELLPHARDGSHWRLSNDAPTIDLTRASDRVERLLETVVRHGMRESAGQVRAGLPGLVASPAPSGARLRDLALLISGEPEFARRTALNVPTAARIDLPEQMPEHGEQQVVQLGAACACLLLAAQPWADDDGALARRAELVGRVLGGDTDGALRLAVADLRRRGLEVAAPRATTIAHLHRGQLALALLAGLSASTIDALTRQIQPFHYDFPLEPETEGTIT
jgi:hypothetical protein